MANKVLVQIKQLNIIGEDERGLTADFCLPRKQDEFIFITRTSGSLSGNTYHEGKVSSTAPKIFILVSGEILLSYRKVGTEDVFQEKITAPATIEIAPFVTHNVNGISDYIIMECNSIADIQSDRHKEIVEVVGIS